MSETVGSKERRVVGPPGCGKTSRLGKLCHFGSQHFGSDKVLVCSLTRAAANVVANHEFEGQRISVPRQNIGTLHSFAYRAIGKKDIADTPKGIAAWNDWITQDGNPALRITLEGQDLDDSATDGYASDTYGDAAYSALGIARARCQPIGSLPASVRDFSEKWEQFKAEFDMVDFHEMIEICYNDIAVAPGDPSVLLLDEGQDTPANGMRLIRKWGEKCSHFVTVGDPLQNLYSWAGSEPEGMTKPELPQDQTEVLSQSYRVPRVVQELSMKWVSELRSRTEKMLGKKIEYSPRREKDGSIVEGKLRRIGNAHWRYVEPAIYDAEKYCSEGKSVMFIASCSYMLEPLISSLRRQGIPFWNPYRTKNGRWNPLNPSRGQSCADRLCNFLRLDDRIWGDEETRLWTVKELHSWVDIIEAKGLLKNGAKTEIKALAALAPIWDPQNPDRNTLTLTDLEQWFLDIACVLDLMQDIQDYKAIPWLRRRLTAVKKKAMEFPMSVVEKRGPEVLKKKPQITVGTIHSLKGAEASCVYIFPDLSKTGMNNYMSIGPEHDGVMRAFYVALTRAREDLILLQRSTPWAVSWPN